MNSLSLLCLEKYQNWVSRCYFHSTPPIQDICLSEYHEKRFFLFFFASIFENERIRISSKDVFSCISGVYRNLWSACYQKTTEDWSTHMPWEYPVVEAHISRQMCIVDGGHSVWWENNQGWRIRNNNYKLIAELNFENNFVRVAIYHCVVKDVL